MLPNFLDPGTYVRGTAQLLNDIAGPAPVRRRAPKPRKPRGMRKITVKTATGRSSTLELDDELVSNKELLELRYDQKKMVNSVEDRLEDTEKRFDDLLERLKVKEAVGEQKPGGLFGGFGGGVGGAPPAWVPMVPVAAIIADDFFESAGATAIGLGGLGLLRMSSGEPLSVVDLLAFGLGTAVVVRKYQETQPPRLVPGPAAARES